jgi:hypothetical protein
MPPAEHANSMVCYRGAEIDHHTDDICNLYEQVKAVNALVISCIVGLRHDVQNGTTVLNEIKNKQGEQSATITELLQKQESCLTKDTFNANICVIKGDVDNRIRILKDEIEPYKKAVDRHTTYFEIIAGVLVAFWAWASGYLNKLL